MGPSYGPREIGTPKKDENMEKQPFCNGNCPFWTNPDLGATVAVAEGPNRTQPRVRSVCRDSEGAYLVLMSKSELNGDELQVSRVRKSWVRTLAIEAKNDRSEATSNPDVYQGRFL